MGSGVLANCSNARSFHALLINLSLPLSPALGEGMEAVVLSTSSCWLLGR